MSLASLTNDEIEDRQRLGLVRTSVGDADYYRMKKEVAHEQEEKARKEMMKKKPCGSARVYDENCSMQCEEDRSTHVPSF